MFRVMELRNGAVTLLEGADHVRPPPDGVLRWIDLQEQEDPQLDVLRDRFGFHPLALEDCRHLDQRPKLEEYGDYLFLVTQGFRCPGDKWINEIEMQELHAFIGERYLVTVHLDSIHALDEVWKRAAGDPKLVGKGVDFLSYLVTDGVVDDNFPILDRIADELENLEDAVLEAPQRSSLARIFELKHHLVTMRKVLSPQRDVLSVLAKRGDARISDRTALYFRDIYDHLVRINESIESNRDLLGNALEAYLSATAQRTNEIMKYLTIMSAVFLPLTFIVGFFGQNFEDMPGIKNWVQSDALMWTMVTACIATPVGMVAWFRRKGWL